MKGSYPVLFPVKRGDFARVTPSAFEIAAKFYRHVGKTATCWVWITQKHQKGYGTFKLGGISTRGSGNKKRRHTMRASRLAWILSFGAIPNGMMVLHHCDNPSCVRPDHLFLGNAKDNYEDALAKGRRYPGINRGLGPLPAEGEAVKRRKAK